MRKAEEKTPPGTAGEDARGRTSATVTAPCFLPPHQVLFLAAPKMALSLLVGHFPASSDLTSQPINNPPTDTGCKKLGVPLRPGHELM